MKKHIYLFAFIISFPLSGMLAQSQGYGYYGNQQYGGSQYNQAHSTTYTAGDHPGKGHSYSTTTGPTIGYAPAEPGSGPFEPDFNGPRKRVQVALLLDTSGSMEGLINQARSQLWGIINELAINIDSYEPPLIEIALFEFGSSRISYSDGYIRQIVPFTLELDWVSAELFSLRTGGSREYCGAVIQAASDHLNWSYGYDDIRLMFIAGNESFTQGGVNFRKAIASARNKGIIVNTIFCGDFGKGRSLHWEEGALLGGGTYSSIEKDMYAPYQSSPYDQRLNQLNASLNSTYVPYGNQGTSMKQRQETQDHNASKYGGGVAAERTITKASAHYQNTNWDLVDAVDAGQVRLQDVPDADLPTEMKGMDLSQKQAFVAKKKREREQVKGEIRQLAKKDQIVKEKQLAAKPPSKGAQVQEKQTLGKAMVRSLPGKVVKKKPVVVQKR